MAGRTGTYDLASLLANKQTTAAQIGPENLAPILQTDLDISNGILFDLVSGIATVTSERMMLAGASDVTEPVEVSQYSRARTQKAAVGATLGLPLRLFQLPIGWTRKYFEQTSAADVILRARTAQKGYANKVVKEMKKAIYLSANYTFRDQLVAPAVDLPVKRFANADSFPVPNGPNGEVFTDATHTHYTATASLTAAGFLANINNVAEHTNSGAVQVYINAADETAVRALSGFTAYIDSRLTLNTAANQPGVMLDWRRMNNRAIGIMGAAEVWVKPWAIANYAVAMDTAAPTRAIGYRTRTGQRADGLRIAAELDAFPLHAQYMEAEFGFGVMNRVAGAVYYFASGTYADPVI